MSFAISGPLQAAVYVALTSDAALTALVGADIYDAVPAGPLPATYVRLGSESATDASDISGNGAIHRLSVSVITTDPGFAAAKEVAAAISDALQDAALPLSRGQLISLRFEQANATRSDGGSTRQIDMRFRARVSDD